MTTRDPFGQDSYNPSIANGRPPVAPGLSGRMELAPHFPGIVGPRTDFQAVRDGRRSFVLYYDVDLSIARSIAAGTHAILNAAGNSFFADQAIDLAGNNDGGIAVVHFQDTDIAPGGTPITVQPGAVFKIPFTQLLIENFAQAGKKLRIVYGIDLDFQPGTTQNVSVTGFPAGTENEGGGNALMVGIFADAIVRADAAFFLGNSSAAVAGNNSTVQLFNPVGSGINAYVDSVSFGSGTGMTMMLYADSTLYGGANQGNHKDMDAVALAKSQVTFGSHLGPSGNALMQWIISANIPFEVKLSPAVRLTPGVGLNVWGGTVNTAMYANFQWREFTS